MTAGGLRTADYEFELPHDLIAQHPAAVRDACRLMVIERTTGRIVHARFADLADLIPARDVLAVNTSRVLKARLFGTRERGGKAEALLIDPRDDGRWNAFVRPASRMRDGARIYVAPDVALVVTRTDTGLAVAFESSLSVDEILERHGHVPLPPYIARADAAPDAEHYQTVYAAEPGSIAAPTAGLHFTPELLAALSTKGVSRADVVLHVGPGTFKPVAVDNPADHVMHVERFTLSAASASALNSARLAEPRAAIWAVGTTTLRVLETIVDERGRFAAGGGTTNIFIRPPHVVRGADRLITNFHLPRSTLLMLVSAFAGYELTREAYEVAIRERYRFYSYGDAMCVV